MLSRTSFHTLTFLTLFIVGGASQANADSSIMPGVVSDDSSEISYLLQRNDSEPLETTSDLFETQVDQWPWLLAHAEGEEEAAAGGEETAEGEVNPQCAAFALDPDADLGDVIRAGCKPTLIQMSALMDNPLGNVAMLFTQFDIYVKKEPVTKREDTQYNYMGIAQFPKKINDNWNLINRVIWNVGSVPLDQSQIDAGFGTGAPGELLPPPEEFPGQPLPIDLFSGRTTGFGDLYYVGLFAKSKPGKCGKGKLATCLWGLGFDVGLPTASEDILGTGKYTGGPSALGVYIGPKWKFGALATHYKDFASRDSGRADVNMTNLQYLYYYSLSPTMSIGAAPNIIINWEQSSGNKVTVPIGIGFNATVNIGKAPVRFGAEFMYSAIQPDDVLGTKWNFRFYVIPAAPSALFSWMQ